MGILFFAGVFVWRLEVASLHFPLIFIVCSMVLITFSMVMYFSWCSSFFDEVHWLFDGFHASTIFRMPYWSCKHWLFWSVAWRPTQGHCIMVVMVSAPHGFWGNKDYVMMTQITRTTMKKSPWCNLKTVGHCRYINHADDGSDNHHGDGDDLVMAVAMMKKEQTRQLSLPLKNRLQNQSPLMFETNEMVHWRWKR